VWYIGRQLIPLPAVASTAVAWHRLLLRDEHPGPGIYLRLDSIVAGYAILAFWIGVIILAPGYVSRIFQIVTGTSATMGDVFFCIFPGAAIIGGISLWLLLPHGRATGTLALIVMSLLWIPVGMISVGMLSLAYRHFFERSA